MRLSSALPLLALLACKLGKDNEQTDRPLPAPEPASTTPPSRPVEAEPPRDRPKDPAPRPPSEGTPASPKPATPTPTSTSTPTATSTATADAGAPAASDAGAPASANDKLNQCIAKCQGSLSACLAKPVPLDAGVPSLESMSECKKAFEDCRAACSP
jgi:outer membrane biosynthesis protein TonB